MHRAPRSCSCLSLASFSVLAWVVTVGCHALPAWADALTVEPAPPTPAASAEAPNPTSPTSAEVSSTPTHRQTRLIAANVDGQPQTSITCFCLTPDDRILAGCGGETGEVRVFDADGKFVESWSTPVKPEAIFAQADGAILLAGEGQLVRLTPAGKVELQKRAPHVAGLSDPAKMREEVIAQLKQQAEALTQQSDQYQQMIDRAQQQITSLNEQLAALGDSADAARNKRLLERRLASQERMKQQYEAAKQQWAEIVKQNSPSELTDDQIDERVKAAIAYKLKASSVSAAGDEVFLAAPSPAGHGFAIWRMDPQFENATQIVSELRGCCGQMDVKANAQGLFVAENSRHRVCRYDRDGKLICAWGESARAGLDGFGSCCNPMNVAFGPENAVYTAEDNTGRIKRYSADGKLLGLVGSVDLVPGCKNCSIAVSADGGRVYMLDITRNHIVRMDALPPGEAAKQAAERTGTDASPRGSSTARAVVAGLKALFGSDE